MRRPSLADLAAKKPSAAVETPETVAADVQRPAKAGTQPDGRKGILVRVKPEGWRELRNLAADLTIDSGEPVTMQSLLLDAINDLLKRNGRPPVA